MTYKNNQLFFPNVMQSLSTLLLLFYLISSFYLTAWLAEMWNAWNVWIVLKLQGMHLTACQRETASDPASAYYLLLKSARIFNYNTCVRLGHSARAVPMRPSWM